MLAISFSDFFGADVSVSALEIQSVSFFYIVNFSVFTTFSRSVFFYLVTTRLAALQDTGSARYGFYDSPKLFNLNFLIFLSFLIFN